MKVIYTLIHVISIIIVSNAIKRLLFISQIFERCIFIIIFYCVQCENFIIYLACELLILTVLTTSKVTFVDIVHQDHLSQYKQSDLKHTEQYFVTYFSGQ